MFNKIMIGLCLGCLIGLISISIMESNEIRLYTSLYKNYDTNKTYSEVDTDRYIRIGISSIYSYYPFEFIPDNIVLYGNENIKNIIEKVKNDKSFTNEELKAKFIEKLNALIELNDKIEKELKTLKSK